MAERLARPDTYSGDETTHYASSIFSFFLLTRQGELIDASNDPDGVTGYAISEIREFGRWLKLVTEKSGGPLSSAFEDARRGLYAEREIEWLRPDGGKRLTRMLFSPSVGQGGGERIHVMIENIGRKRLIEKLAGGSESIMRDLGAVLADEFCRGVSNPGNCPRIAAVYDKFGKICHDFNGMLQVIHGYAELLLVRTEGADQHMLYAEKIKKEARRAERLSREFFPRNAARAGGGREMLNLAKVAESVVGDLLPTATGVLVRVDAGESLPEIFANESDMYRLLMNLCTNAVNAMPGGGVLRLVLGVAAKAGDCGGSACGGRWIEITVSDTGVGIIPEIRDKIFEAGFTTSKNTSNAGLGLAIAREILSTYNGTIGLEQTSGAGSVFKIRIPLEG